MTRVAAVLFCFVAGTGPAPAQTLFADGFDADEAFLFRNFQATKTFRSGDFAQLDLFRTDTEPVFLKVYLPAHLSPGSSEELYFLDRLRSRESVEITVSVPNGVWNIFYDLYSPSQARSGSLSMTRGGR